MATNNSRIVVIDRHHGGGAPYWSFGEGGKPSPLEGAEEAYTMISPH
jgi:hypothetical protein